MSRFYSGLEVVPPPTPSGIEVVSSPSLEINWNRSAWIETTPNCPPTVVSQPVPRDVYTKHSTWKIGAPQEESQPVPGDLRRAGRRPICGLRPRTFWVLIVVAAVVVIGAVAGGVIASVATHNKQALSLPPMPASPSSLPPPPPSNHTKSSLIFRNSSLTALRWTDTVGSTKVEHSRVYFQLKSGTVVESARDSNTLLWTVSEITEPAGDTALGTSLAAVVGYPHLDTSVATVKSVYLAGNTGTIYERQSPYKTQVGVWGDDNFSGLYSVSKESSIASYWQQNFSNGSQAISVLFQEIGANSLTIGKYHGTRTADFDWVATRNSISILDGSPLTLAPTGIDSNLGLYLAGGDGMLTRYQYRIDTDSLSNAKTTTFPLSPHHPLLVAAIDNTPFFTDKTVPECTKTASLLTHLILFATLDRSSLSLVSWNCSSGFVGMDADVAPLLGKGRTYLSLAAAQQGGAVAAAGGTVYVMFDTGDGPEVEESTVPIGGLGGSGWSVVGNVPAKS